MAAHERAVSDSPWVWEELVNPLDEAPDAGHGVDHVEEPPLPDPLEVAFQKGFEGGLAEGEARSARDLKHALSALSKAVRAFGEAQSGMLADLESNAVALAVGIARELVVTELERSPETVAELVREGVSSFALDEPLTVRLHPADLALVAAAGDSHLSGSRPARWEPDPRVGRGGCLVEGPGMIVDGRLDLALERVYRAVTRD